MNKRNIVIISILILGIVFSATFGFKFNLSQGFAFKGFWITFPIQLFDFAGKSSNELSLTSQLIGYLFYFLFGILSLKRLDMSVKRNKILIIVFFSLISLVFISDFYSFYQDLNNQFTGRHFRISLIVFLIGLIILNSFSTNKTKTEI